MREIYTGTQFSRNQFKGNFYWPSQEFKNGERFDQNRPYYAFHIDVYDNRIRIYFESNEIPIRTHLIYRSSPNPPLEGEWLYFRTQQDLAEFLQLNPKIALTPG